MTAKCCYFMTPVQGFCDYFFCHTAICCYNCNFHDLVSFRGIPAPHVSNTEYLK